MNPITELARNEIFVFGSNEVGIHGAGAAKTARELFGAKHGVGIGRTGQCYAIPTKDFSMHTLPLEAIQHYINDFLIYTDNHPELLFLVTPIGTGLAGYTHEQIAPLFKSALHSYNISLPEEFVKILEQKTP